MCWFTPGGEGVGALPVPSQGHNTSSVPVAQVLWDAPIVHPVGPGGLVLIPRWGRCGRYTQMSGHSDVPLLWGYSSSYPMTVLASARSAASDRIMGVLCRSGVAEAITCSRVRQDVWTCIRVDAAVGRVLRPRAPSPSAGNSERSRNGLAPLGSGEDCCRSLEDKV